jgi:hypothetical protein
MASHLRDTIRHGRDHPDTHASESRWRHQESGSFAKHAARAGAPREADGRHGMEDLADFLKGSRVEPQHTPSASGSGPKYTPIAVAGNAAEQSEYGESSGRGDAIHVSGGTMEVMCGPLLNYRRMESETWFGSVLIVTKGGGLGDCVVPELKLRIGGDAQESDSIENEAQRAPQPSAINGVGSANFEEPTSTSQLAQSGVLPNNESSDAGGNVGITVKGTRLYSDPAHTFWRFSLQVPMQQVELRCDYYIPGLTFKTGTKTDKQSFFVPSISESMRIMFHSCNGFSVGTDEEAWSGPALWNDVRRVHARTPFHVM